MFDPKSLLNSANANGLISKMLGGMATKNFAAGLLTGGVATSLLGGGKDTVETAAKVGGLALLGTLAYKAYGNYKEQQQSGGNASVKSAVTQSAQSMMSQGQSLLAGLLGGDAAAAEVPAEQPANESLSLAILRAMIGAAKADGHMDAAEMEKIMGQMQGAGLSEPEKMLLMQEMANTPNVNEIANSANSPEESAQIYLAALLVCDSQCNNEIAYLQSLATALKLEPAFTQNLQRELIAASANKAAA